MLDRLSVAALCIFVPLLSWAQPAQGPRSFEAAVVRPSKGPARGHGANDPGQISYSDVTLYALIQRAYDARSYQIKGGPSWIDSEHYEVVAKVPKGASKDDVNVMLQGLLADRFKLAVHRETKEGPNYSLVVDKGGPRLKESATGDAEKHPTLDFDDSGSPQVPPGAIGRPVTIAGNRMATLISGAHVTILANSQSLSALAAALTKLMDGPVRDLTGLTGSYNFSLDFSPPAGMRMPQMGPPGECPTCGPDGDPLPSVFQAVKEKLGLRLESNRGPIDLLIIDRVEKAPTEN